MSKEQVKTIMEIVSDNVEEVLNKYLADDLVRRIKSEISYGVQWDLVNKVGDSDD